jgi:sigma-B regulation protein RsbU (phosphoserine phosphatase)
MRSDESECAQDGGKKPDRRPRTGPRRRPARLQLEASSVLVVEDDAMSAKLLVVALGAEGCRVEVAPSAEDALARLRTFRPDLIVVDLILPLMSGLLLTQRLKADPATRDIPVIAMSAINGAATERIAHQAGCAAYVRKPIDPLAFTQLVATHLGGGP